MLCCSLDKVTSLLRMTARLPCLCILIVDLGIPPFQAIAFCQPLLTLSCCNAIAARMPAYFLRAQHDACLNPDESQHPCKCLTKVQLGLHKHGHELAGLAPSPVFINSLPDTSQISLWQPHVMRAMIA